MEQPLVTEAPLLGVYKKQAAITSKNIFKLS